MIGIIVTVQSQRPVILHATELVALVAGGDAELLLPRVRVVAILPVEQLSAAIVNAHELMVSARYIAADRGECETVTDILRVHVRDHIAGVRVGRRPLAHVPVVTTAI